MAHAASFLQHEPPVPWPLPVEGVNRRLCVSAVFEEEKNPHYQEEREDTAAPFYKDERVRLGAVVHAVGYNSGGRCLSARIAGHLGFKPDDVTGWVFLALDYPPRAMEETGDGSFRMWRQERPGERPGGGTWHWPRACPDGL